LCRLEEIFLPLRQISGNQEVVVRKERVDGAMDYGKFPKFAGRESNPN